MACTSDGVGGGHMNEADPAHTRNTFKYGTMAAVAYSTANDISI